MDSRLRLDEVDVIVTKKEGLWTLLFTDLQLLLVSDMLWDASGFQGRAGLPFCPEDYTDVAFNIGDALAAMRSSEPGHSRLVNERYGVSAERDGRCAITLDDHDVKVLVSAATMLASVKQEQSKKRFGRLPIGSAIMHGGTWIYSGIDTFASNLAEAVGELR